MVRHLAPTSVDLVDKFRLYGLAVAKLEHQLAHRHRLIRTEQDGTLSEVARLLGDSEKTVETVYGKHSPDYLRRAVTRLNLGTKKAPVFQL